MCTSFELHLLNERDKMNSDWWHQCFDIIIVYDFGHNGWS